MTKLKVGVIGCGGIANVKHLPALSTFPENVELTYFCDIIEQRAINAAKGYGGYVDCAKRNDRNLTDDEKLLKLIVESGFSGTLMIEYEGHSFYLNDAVEQIGRHIIMEN